MTAMTQYIAFTTNAIFGLGATAEAALADAARQSGDDDVSFLRTAPCTPELAALINDIGGSGYAFCLLSDGETYGTAEQGHVEREALSQGRQLLSTLLGTLTDRPADDLEVMQDGMPAGKAAAYWWTEDGPGGVERMTVGASQGEDQQRGAYEWWPIYLDDEQVAELRDDASGYVLHVTSDYADVVPARVMIVTADNLDEVREHVTALDQRAELTVGCKTWTFPLSGGAGRGCMTVWPDAGRGAWATNSDSQWGDWDEEARVLRLDDGGVISEDGEITQ